jgi:hypothetical protein
MYNVVQPIAFIKKSTNNKLIMPQSYEQSNASGTNCKDHQTVDVIEAPTLFVDDVEHDVAATTDSRSSDPSVNSGKTDDETTYASSCC